MNPFAFDLIKEFEGCRLTAYKDIVGVWTIGWGTTGEDVCQGLQITQEDANKRLKNDLELVEKQVQKLVKVPLTDEQWGALISFAYNLGTGALAGSTLLKLLNKGDPEGARQEFAKWVHAGGKVVPGLVRRRAAEAELFGSE